MLKLFAIFLVMVEVCNCQNYSLHPHKKPNYYYDPYYHHLLYGGGILYYLSFILIKIKVAFVIGTILTIFIVAGKFYAIIKYAEYMKKPSSHHETEKIYVPSSSHMHDDGPPSFSPSMNSYPPSSYSGGVTVDKLPPNAEIAGGGHYYDAPPQNPYGGNYGTGRYSLNSYRYYDLFISMLRKLNLTKIAFRAMKLDSRECRKKFVCKIDYEAKNSILYSTTLNLMRDEYYDKYRTNVAVEELTDCDRLYQRCKLKL